MPEHVLVLKWTGKRDDVVPDEQLVRHMVSNLLSNAVKYSPGGGLVRFEVIQEDSQVCLTVMDARIGIPEQGREHIFEAFHRFSNVGAISGTGLGMAILKRAVERHGGEVEFESMEGKGTTWRVTLPLSEAPAEFP